MKRWLLYAVAGSLFTLGSLNVWAASTGGSVGAGGGSELEKYLSPAEFEKITGLKVAKVVGRNAVPGASGLMNFIDKDNQVLLAVTRETMDKAVFKQMKEKGGLKSAFKGPIKGVGEDAYTGPPSGEQFILAFLQGNHWVTLAGSLNFATMKPRLSMKQMQALAAVMIPRLK